MRSNQHWTISGDAPVPLQSGARCASNGRSARGRGGATGAVVAAIGLVATACIGGVAGAAGPGGALAAAGLNTRFTAQDLSLSPGLAISASAVQGAAPVSDAAAPPIGTDAAPRPMRFGDEGTVQLNIFGDYANDFDDDWMAGGQFGISWFFVQNLSLDLQLEQWGISQDGPNAYAIGPALLLRWHFLAMDEWSLYADAGCGIIYATNPVPWDGSRFNFTPRVGIGASIAVGDRARIMTGVRWFHISNANTSTPNPGRDSMEIYAGLSLPF